MVKTIIALMLPLSVVMLLLALFIFYTVMSRDVIVVILSAMATSILVVGLIMLVKWR